MSAERLVVDLGLVVLAAVFLAGAVRAAIGPTGADRATGTDLCFFALVATVGLVAVRAQQEAFVDVVLVATLVGFLATVALARLVDREQT